MVIIISLIFSSLILLPFSGSLLKSVFNPSTAGSLVDVTSNPLFIILSAAVNALIMPVMPIFACILYFNSIAGEGQGQSVSKEEPVSDKVKVEDLYAKPYSEDHPDNPDNKA